MSALCRFCFFGVICISFSTTLCSEVEWRNRGESITIKCECKKEAFLLNVMKGLQKDVDIFYSMSMSTKTTKAYPNRTQHHGTFPNFQILLKNLTLNDTGVYWCVYKTQYKEIDDCKGSMLLIVRDPVSELDRSSSSPQSCDSNQHLVLTFVFISSTLLFMCFMTLLLLAIRKVKKSYAKNKPRPIPHNDVYEDMRGTIRR